jgi:hypothetical protein
VDKSMVPFVGQNKIERAARTRAFEKEVLSLYFPVFIFAGKVFSVNEQTCCMFAFAHFLPKKRRHFLIGVTATSFNTILLVCPDTERTTIAFLTSSFSKLTGTMTTSTRDTAKVSLLR